MKVFSLHQNLFTWLCIKPNENRLFAILNKFFTLVAFASQIICVISSAIFINTHIADDLEDALFAVFQMVATASGFYTLVIVLMIRYSIMAVLEKIQMFCDLSEFYSINVRNNFC